MGYIEPMKNTYHKNGTITYWSVYNQQWVKNAASIPDEEFAAMSFKDREKSIRHLRKG